MADKEKYEEIANCFYKHDIGKLKQLLTTLDVNYTRYDGGESLLQRALGWGPNMKIISLLLNSGANIEYKDRKQKTPLMFAAEANSIYNVKTLVKKGADIHAEDHEGCTALCYAMSGENPDIRIAKYLLDKGARLKHAHLQSENIHFIKLFVKYDSFANVAASFNYLLRSVEDLQHAKILIENGCDVNHISSLSRAFKHGNIDLARYFIESGVDISSETVGDIYCIEYAELLMSHGYDVVNHVPYVARGTTIIHHTEDIDFIRYLIHHGAKIDNKLLFSQAEFNRYEVAKFLLDNKLVDINEKDDEGKTVLHSTVRQGHIKMIKLLVNNDADIDAKDDYGNVPTDMTSNKKITSYLNKKRLQLRKKRA
ncbi:ankyrin repeat PH and SEC7 domain containing protein [Paramecium bursaria Chlorella virus AN69C]|nr:ankyrin repeat PH and SEC7 domain containing protein [Paramecium bursaria Chlorella virus AN69C]